MSIELPRPIADFVEANARLDLDGMMKPFRRDALFIDNGKRFQGEAAIRELFEQEVISVKAIFVPDAVREEEGDIVVEGPAHGDFPGSPLRFNYRFTLADGAIETLETKV
ncbi:MULTISPECIES: nuclear transport factor 2 family protein [unclassified Sphingomonas]|uniref:nuclear transport factor 2 family protein n=1 Tax=unclassified Sphingomonas TaxID=196159 RepID=UPI00082F7DFE|nr:MULTISPECIES: nuclear transport factor 2 family protein [unclassified Sphingomonas]